MFLLVINEFISSKENVDFHRPVHEELVHPGLFDGPVHIGHGREVDHSIAAGSATGHDANGADRTHLLVLMKQGILEREI